ncbi:MAG: UTRA domain-containing protein [Ectothiorhodospiraceae bacterium]|nr:UTRA domain-containing protein [Ectothiorhodospiraceae bacterium]
MSRPSPYRAVKAHVLARIRSGEWPPGTLVPREEDLAETFGCARMTVHRALRELADEGVVERRRRAGTRVALPTTRTAPVEIPRVDREVEAMGASYRYLRLARATEPASPSAAARLGVPEGTEVLRVECLHHANDSPFQLEERWISLDVVPAAREESFADVAPNVWLLERLPWSDVEHVIGATNATRKVAGHLGIEPGEAVLEVERRTWLERRVITYVRFLHPGRFYRLRTAGRPG